MFNDYLTKIGLTSDQAKVYSALLEKGTMNARKISQIVDLKRGLTYKVLVQLEEAGLIEKNDKLAKVALFTPKHPNSLKDLADRKVEETTASQKALQGVIGQMTSAYNLLSGKPNVRFFEGEKGVKEVLDDSLYAKGEVLSFADIESIQKYIPKINEWYANEREKLGIKKRGIVLDTEFTRNFLKDYYRGITDTRFIKAAPEPFKTVMQIYDNTISYITLSESEMFGVIIESEQIALMHRYVFEVVWNGAADKLS